MFMKKMIAASAFLLFAVIGLAGDPAEAQAEPHMAMAPVAPDPDAVCDTSSVIQSFEAVEEAVSDECRLDCWDGYLFCLELAPPSQCLPGYHDCLGEC